MLAMVAGLVETALASADPGTAARAFGDAVLSTDASYVQIRRYRRPGGRLTSQRHWDAGGVLVRDARPGWVGSSGFHYICLDQNPLLRAVRDSHTQYRFSDFAPHDARSYQDYWGALGEAGMAEGWGANAYGTGGAVASVHVGVPDRAAEPALGRAVRTAGSIVAEHLLMLDAPLPDPPARVSLTVRERDAMSFVAEGKTDWEIGTILGVSEATARFHVDNARRKLGGVNRSHAVARFIAECGLP